MKTDKATALLENRHESLDVEIKNWLEGLSNNTEKCRLAKEIIALANNGGGHVLIGFNDDDDHSEIQPAEGELEAFTQDALSGLIERYIEPPCQVSVYRHSISGSTVEHPIIEVPGNHRTPIWAKRQSPDGANILQTNTVYVRRPGGSSEPARTQDDWERLIDRLVRARQADLLDAMRNVLNPGEAPDTGVADSLDEWLSQSKSAWLERLDGLEVDDPRRFLSGYWEAAFVITDFHCESVRILNDFFEREMPRLGGWPPFVIVNERDRRPVPIGRLIEAWLGAMGDFEPGDEQWSNYWRASIDGNGYLVHPFSEDNPAYCQNRTPQPVGRFFDRIYHPYNIVELLLAIRALAERFAEGEGQYRIRLRYTGMENRQLESHSLRWGFGMDGRCDSDIVESEHLGLVSNLQNGIVEEAQLVLAPVYEQFNFAEVSQSAIRQAVEDLGGS